MKLLAVDGNSILNRAFYGVRPLTTKDGRFTNAIYGFLTMLNKIENDTTPDCVAIAFDLKAPTFRHKAYSGYKAQRKGMPQELASQLQPLKDLLTLLGYKLVTCVGYEADDILGTLSAECEKEGWECVIATGDRDSLQLVSNLTTVRLAATKQGTATAIIYDKDKIMEDYGVSPRELIEIKAIQGDTSDNIPGVAGIGPKGAGDLIKKYKTVEYIYEHLDELDIKDGVRKKLEASKDNAILSRMLGEINREAPIDKNLADYSVSGGDDEKAADFMADLELFSLIEKMGLRNSGVKKEEKKKEKEKSTFSDCLSEDIDVKSVFSKDEKDIFITYIKESKTSPECVYACNSKEVYRLPVERLSDFSQLENKIVAYSSKEIYSFLDKNGIDKNNIIFDITLAAYLLNPSSTDYSVSRLCEEYKVEPAQFDAEEGVLQFVCENGTLPDLYEKLKYEISDKNQKKLMYEIELPLSKVLAKMENVGFAVDKEGIENYGRVINEEVLSIQNQIYEEVGYEFNINSPKQLGVALFEKLGLPAKKKTKSGYSTNADVLEDLRKYHPVIDMILKYRTLAKLKSTYCDGLLKVIGDDGRIHTNFNQTETRTGRISSTEPNLQNIPVRTEIGRELRRFFCAKEGCVLVDADYSQIELRVLADISKDENMMQAFKENEDIHTATASQVFNMPRDFVTPIMRSRAKAVNFGIVYGIGAFSLSKDIGVTTKEASNYIKAYLGHYSGVDKYMHEVTEKAKEDGYVETVFGRRRYLPELKTGNHITRAFGERVARNMPIQGTAADIIKIAMIKVDNRLQDEGLKAKLILQVHDELIVEAPEEEKEKVSAILKEEMENAVSLSVPLIADAAMGKTWYDAKG